MLEKQITINKKSIKEVQFSQDSSEQIGVKYNERDLLDRIEHKRTEVLATSLLVNKNLCPDIYEATANVRSLLSPLCDIEVFVYSDPVPQALNFGGDSKCAYVMLSSGLVDLIDKEELAFVIGHEAAHYIYKHYMYPPMETARNHIERINILSLQRAAEISADRVGFICTGDKNKAFSAVIKLLSGLSDRHLKINVKAYLDQVSNLFNADGKRDIISHNTHPTFAIRLRALLYFQMSEPYYNINNRMSKAPLTKERLDNKIEKDIRVLGGFYVDKINNAALHNLSMWASFLLFTIDDNLTKAEQSFLQQFYSAESYNNAIEYIKTNGQSCIQKKLDEHVLNVKNISNINIKWLKKHLNECAKIAGGSDAVKQSFLTDLFRSIRG